MAHLGSTVCGNGIHYLKTALYCNSCVSNEIFPRKMEVLRNILLLCRHRILNLRANFLHSLNGEEIGYYTQKIAIFPSPS